MIKKIIIAILLVSSLVLASAATWLYSKVDSALPILEGKKTVFGLHDTATIERDSQGIATFKASSRVDIAVTTGFVHAQERFFQMDLLRRNSAGELSSLFGSLALNYDKSIRRHRFRYRAREIVKSLPSEQALLLKAYTRGVNQGLKYLNTSPFEYLLLQQEPVQWSEEDSILTIFSMYIDLQYHDGQRERSLGLMNAILSADVYAFLDPKGSIWDAAIDGSQYSASPMPTSAWPNASASLRHVEATDHKNLYGLNRYQADEFPGSNNWAVSGTISKTGSAIIANDMHLGIKVPNTWFRARFEYPHNNQQISITGVTLPGTPNMVIGSNNNIAWGFTNSYGDYSDVVVLQTTGDGSKYLTPQGEKGFTYHQQVIAIKDEQPIELTIKETIWGPVIGKNHKGEWLAYRWVAHDKQAINLTAIELETAKNVEQAFNIASRSGIPAQNMMVGDKEGNIGWTIMGPIPKKFGDIGNTPTYWHEGNNGWQGYLSSQQYPRVMNPVHNRLWTANSRVVGHKMLEKIGNGGYALGARSQQIRDGLFALSHFDEKALLAISLDDRALFLERWKTFLLTQVLTEKTVAEHQQFLDVKTLLDETKTFVASTDSVSYRLVRNFRINLRDLVFSELNLSLSKLDDSYQFRSIRQQLETPLWQLINQQSDNFLMRPLSSWSAVFNEALQKTITDMKVSPKNEVQPLSAATWGQQNTSAIQHPLSKAIPFIAKWLDMPATPLSGDSYMPKVQGKAFGASQRMVVSPGHENTGIFQMPTSQAGHPWSPYYGVGHSDWEQGKPSPFLPGKTQYTLTLLSY
ncbi:MAG: penicillin acylase family protein [Litorilituus sp.]|jgi:penicillin amidase|nr:penicillin acylase family protein [Litorilituus sp.]